MPPFRTSVVHIVEFRREEFLDRHESHVPPAAGKRPFLCVLSPDTLQLVTAEDASDFPAPASSSLLRLATGKPDRTPRAQLRPISLLHKLATGGSGAKPPLGGHLGQGQGQAQAEAPSDPVTAAGAAGLAAAVAASAAGAVSSVRPSSRGSGEDADGGDLGEQLDEGQVLRFAVALSQVAGLECQGQRIKLLFHRQKPHRGESGDDWKAMMKAAVLPFALPIEAYKHKNWEVTAYLNRHRRDPFVSSVVLEADSAQEAAALHQAIEEAIARLAQAVQWLSADLPLQYRPVVALVTASPAGAGGPSAGGLAGGASASPVRGSGGGGGLGAGAGCAAAEQIVCAFPRMQQPLDIPIPAAAGAASEDADADLAGAADVAYAADVAAGADVEGDMEVHVWLHSPLGPAVATITTELLRKSAEAGGAPLVVAATAHGEGAAAAAEAAATEAAAGVPAGSAKLEVVLQFKAERHTTPFGARRRASLKRSGGSSGGGGSAGGGWQDSLRGAGAAGEAWAGPPGGSSGVGGGGVGTSALPAMLAVLCVPLLAAGLQLFLHGGAEATASVLVSVAFLVSSLAAMAAIVVMQLKVQAGQAPAGQVVSPPPQPPPVGWWRLVLLHADLVLESQRSAGAPPVRRVLSPSAVPSAAPSAAVRLDGSAAELPDPIRRLVGRHPLVLTEDIAARFLVGLGSADKAYQGLRTMVEWVEAQGVADLVTQPQPRFQLIKQHYPQVFYCWSSTTDCVVEVECTGRWREAFDALRALGVTERELLRHQFFCMEYAFKLLDARPLPQGKTVKIIDLEGLSMRDVSSSAFKWYLQVGGALLAVNYPQRLHKAFLLNAPAWSGIIWKVLAAFIPQRTREQLMLFTKKQREAAAEALMQWVPAEQLPVQYGGQCTVPLGESQLEADMAAYVARLNAASRSSSPSRIAGIAATASGGASAVKATRVAGEG